MGGGDTRTLVVRTLPQKCVCLPLPSALFKKVHDPLAYDGVEPAALRQQQRHLRPPGTRSTNKFSWVPMSGDSFSPLLRDNSLLKYHMEVE